MSEDRAEEDVSQDKRVAGSRPTPQGDPHYSEATTGPGGNEEFVGRVAGQDEGFDEESGAERRSEGG